MICGGGGGDGPDPAAAGHIRGFDARTGKRRWIFHTIPKPGEFGHDTWGGDSWKLAGGTNNWGGMSVDAQARPRLRLHRIAVVRLLRRQSQRMPTSLAIAF